MEKENLDMFMEISTKETGKEIRPMVSVNILIVMVQLMKVNGNMIYNTEKE
jgi:hypothetical protein